MPNGNGTEEGETPAWEACGRIVPVERADFIEFCAVNLMFVLAALGVVWVRKRELGRVREKKLVARIFGGER